MSVQPTVRITELREPTSDACGLIKVESLWEDFVFLYDDARQRRAQLASARELATKEAARLHGVVIDTTLEMPRRMTCPSAMNKRR